MHDTDNSTSLPLRCNSLYTVLDGNRVVKRFYLHNFTPPILSKYRLQSSKIGYIRKHSPGSIQRIFEKKKESLFTSRSDFHFVTGTFEVVNKDGDQIILTLDFEGPPRL